MVTADRGGYVTTLDAELVGRASVALGAGRDRVEDPVDPAVGIMVVAKPGDAVRAGDPVLEMHFRDRAKLDAAIRLTSRAITIGDQPPPERRLIVGEVL
jgi:thymidine phosphorylase